MITITGIENKKFLDINSDNVNDFISKNKNAILSRSETGEYNLFILNRYGVYNLSTNEFKEFEGEYSICFNNWKFVDITITVD